MAIDLWANFERRWRKLQFYSSFPCILAFIISISLPESPRWLLANKKVDRAKEILVGLSKFNGISLPDFTLKAREGSVEETKKYSYFHLVRNRKVLLLTISIGFMWTTVSLLYYSLVLEAASLGGNMYTTFMLTACADIPSCVTSVYTCDRFGRKKTNLVSLTIAGILIGLLALIPQTLSWKYILNMILVMIAKFFAENGFNGIYTWSFEVFPTVIRSQGISVCVIFQRVGLLAVPFLTTVLQGVSHILPFVFMFALSICACLLGLTLPETNNKPTRERYEDFFEKKAVTSSMNEGIENGEEHV